MESSGGPRASAGQSGAGSRRRHGLRRPEAAEQTGAGPIGQTERGLQQTLLLLDQKLHRALGGVLSFEKLAVQLRRLILHALQGGEAVACQVQGLARGRVPSTAGEIGCGDGGLVPFIVGFRSSIRRVEMVQRCSAGGTTAALVANSLSAFRFRLDVVGARKSGPEESFFRSRRLAPARGASASQAVSLMSWPSAAKCARQQARSYALERWPLELIQRQRFVFAALQNGRHQTRQAMAGTDFEEEAYADLVEAFDRADELDRAGQSVRRADRGPWQDRQDTPGRLLAKTGMCLRGSRSVSSAARSGAAAAATRRTVERRRHRQALRADLPRREDRRGAFDGCSWTG